MRFDQQDALAEADFHMAYGLYDQAADLVKIAIGREPGRRDLKLKLLEIYFVWGNKDLFLDTARELHGSRAQAAPGEWDKVLIMGKQIAPEDSMFKGEAGAAHVDLVDVNLEGGENRVDVDLFAEPDDKPAGLDLEFTSGERRRRRGRRRGSDLDFLLDEPKRGSDEEPTREMDPLSRTQETPTIESPQIDRSSQTLRERAIREKIAGSKAEQTAELSLDDLGLDVDSLEPSGSLEDTTSLEKDATAESAAPLRDDEMTQLAPGARQFRPHDEGAARKVRHRDHRHDLHRSGRPGRRRYRRAAATGERVDCGDEASVDAEGPGPRSRSAVRLGQRTGDGEAGARRRSRDRQLLERRVRRSHQRSAARRPRCRRAAVGRR